MSILNLLGRDVTYFSFFREILLAKNGKYVKNLKKDILSYFRGIERIMRYLFLFSVVIWTGIGCSSLDSEIYVQDNLPHTVAILPFQGEADQGEKLEFVRNSFSNYFSNRGFEQLRLELIDKKLATSGLTPQSDLKKLGETLQVEGIIRAKIDAISNVNAVYLGYRSKLEGTLEFYDVRTEKLIWKGTRAELDYGGVIVYSGQVVEGISTQIDNSSDIGFIRLAEKFCQSLVDSAPKQTQIREVSAPEIKQLRVEASSSVLKPNDRFVVHCVGNPGMQATFSLGKNRPNIPMDEVSSGQYSGSYLVQRGDQESQVAVTVQLTDPFNRQGRKKYEERLFEIKASPPPPPTNLSFRENVLQWQGEGQEYLVYGSSSEVIVPQKIGRISTTSININQPFQVLLVCAVDAEGNQSIATSLKVKEH